MILADIKEGSSYLLGFLGVFSEGDLFFIFLYRSIDPLEINTSNDIAVRI